MSISVPTYAIIIQNSQPAFSSSPFQQLLSLNLSSIISSADQLLNLAFYIGNGSCQSQLYAWIESYTSDFSTVNIWVNLPIPITPLTQLTIYMSVESSSQYPYTGMAPQLTSTYAQYDNGSNIFPYYQPFGNLSALPSGWSELSGTTVNFYTDYIEIEPAPSTGEWNGIYLDTSAFNGQIAWDFYGNMYDAVNAGNLVGPSSSSVGSYDGYQWSEGNTTTNLIYLANNGNQWAFDTGYEDTNENKVYSMYINGSYVNMLINYQSIFTTTSATSTTTNNFQFAPSNNGGSKPSTPIIVYWLRTRAMPPNGVMPSVVSFTQVS